MKKFLLITLFTAITLGLQSQNAFTDLTAMQFGDSILVNWTLKAGSTCFDMHLMRGTDSLVLEPVYSVGGVCGGSDDQYYSYVDHTGLQSPNLYYYRIEASGGLVESNIIHIQFIDAGKFSVYMYPNPSPENITVTIDNQFTPVFLVELYSLQGRLLMQEIEHQNLFTLSTSQLSASPYLLKVTTEDGAVFAQRLIVQ